MKKIYIFMWGLFIFLICFGIAYGYQPDKIKLDKLEKELKGKKIIKQNIDTTTYQMDDNIIRVVPTSRYKDGNIWKITNTTVKKLTHENFKYGVEKNNFKVYFDPNSTDYKNIVKIKRGVGEITLKLDGINKKTKIEYIDNTFVFKDINEYIDVTYEITPTRLKEYITLSEYHDTNIWSFEFEVEDLDYELIDNIMYFYNDGVVVGVFDNPIAWDSTNDVIPCNLTLREQDGDLYLDLIVNDTWLQNAEYPVIIDPTYDDFEYDTGHQGGLNDTLWNWNHTREGGANYYCSPPCSAVDGWDVDVGSGKLRLYATTCAISTNCKHYVHAWTVDNASIFNITNVRNISYSFDASGWIGVPQISTYFEFYSKIDGVTGSLYSFEKTGDEGTGGVSTGGIIDIIRNQSNLTEWNSYKDGVKQLTREGTPTINGSFRLRAYASITGTGGGWSAEVDAYVYYVEYGFQIEPNEPPVLTSISPMHSIYNASANVTVNASGVSDSSDDMLNMSCCKGYNCDPTISGNILGGTEWYDRELADYNNINGHFSAGIYAGVEYVRCKLFDNQSGISDIQRTSYSVISNYSTACDIPNSIWCDDFLYETSFCRMDWENIPDFWDCRSDAYSETQNSPTIIYKMFLGQQSFATNYRNPYDFIVYHYFTRTKNPIISASWEMTQGNVDYPVEMVLTKDLTDILALGFMNNDIHYKDGGVTTSLCTDCWTAGSEFAYKVTLYFTDSATYYDNVSKEFTHYDANTFSLYQNGFEIATNKPLTNNVSDVAPFYLNRIKFFKASGTNLTLDNIRIYKGTVTEYDDTQDHTDAPVEVLPNGTIVILPPEFIPDDADYFGWKSKEDYCKNNIECCTLSNTSTGMRYIITDQICFMRTAYDGYTKESRGWIVQNQYLFFILLIIALMIIMTIIYKRRNE